MSKINKSKKGFFEKFEKELDVINNEEEKLTCVVCKSGYQ